MGIFSRFARPKEEKVNPVYQGLTIYADLPIPISMPRNYKSFAQEGYRGNDTLYKCIKYLSQNGAAIPPKLYTDETMEKEIEHHPLLDKLKHPNPEQSGVAYREAVLGYLFIAGNSYQYAIRSNKKSGPPDELWTLQPDKVKIIPSKTRGIIGYEYEDFPKEMNPILPENIAHLRYWSPDDPIYGMSPIEVGAVIIDQQLAARKWNLALMQNMAKPSGIWSSSTILSPNDRNKLEERLNEKHASSRNAGKAPVIDGGLEWKPTGLPPSELDWLQSIQYNAANIANLYDMAPQLIGDTSASTYDNMEQAKAASYTEAIFPTLDRLYDTWNMWLLPMYPDLKNAYLYYDKETVEVVRNVVQQQLNDATKRANTSWMQGSCTLNEAREIQGLPDVPDGDVFRFGAILVRSSELDKYAEQSLTKPAAPPFPQAEPLNVPQPNGTPGQPNNEPKPPANTNDGKRRLHSLQNKSAADVTHILWQCAPGACAFCVQNEGEIREDGESFSNGVSSPDDCHKFCRCEAVELALPTDMSKEDALGMGLATLASLYGVGVIASRHERDVAEQQAQQDEEDTTDYTDELDYAKQQRLQRWQRKQAYRDFMEAVS